MWITSELCFYLFVSFHTMTVCIDCRFPAVDRSCWGWTARTQRPPSSGGTRWLSPRSTWPPGTGWAGRRSNPSAHRPRIPPSCPYCTVRTVLSLYCYGRYSTFTVRTVTAPTVLSLYILYCYCTYSTVTVHTLLLLYVFLLYVPYSCSPHLRG